MRYTISLLFLALVSGPVSAQNLSGTWRLDGSRSQVNDDAALAGLIAAGAPETLHVTHPANDTLVVESQVNESHARLYVPGRKTETPVFLGTAGSVTMTSRWDGARLIAEGERVFGSGAASAVPVRESYSLSADGSRLNVSIQVGQAESRLSYTRIDSVGTCESWPSPCKKYSP